MRSTQRGWNFIRTVFCIFFFVALNQASAERLVVPADHCVCSPQVKDSFEGPSEFNFGKFTGRCIDSCRYRRFSFLSADGFPAPAVGGASLVVSNFLHEEKYWRAIVPVDQVQRAEVGFEEFLPGVFHVFLLFHFPETNPVLLYPQEEDGSAVPKKVYDLVLSPEGVPPKEGKYNLLDAYLEHYLIGIRVLSKAEVVSWSIKKLKHEISVYSLRMSQDQVKAVLRAGFASGEKNSLRVKYGLFSNNCATSTLDLIDSVVKPDIANYPIYYNFLYALEKSLPIAGPLGTLHVFFSRDLIHEKNKYLL